MGAFARPIGRGGRLRYISALRFATDGRRPA